MSRLFVIDNAPSASESESGPLAFASALTPKRVYIDTFGCQMNQHDSQRMVSLMAAEGYVPTDGPEDADLIVLNSCSVREKAEHKVRTRAGQMKQYKRRRPGVVLAIGGCVAQQEGTRMLDRIPQADIVFGPDHIARLPDLVREVVERRRRISETEFLSREAYRFVDTPAEAPRQVSAYVSIAKGCDKFCTFCVVPFTRGREVSRAAADIVREVETLARQGTREVVLLGQTVNAYGRQRRSDEVPFAELLGMVAKVDGIERIRFTSPHPAEFTDDQIRAFARLEKLCPHMHLPVQSGSNRVLEVMRRGYTREEYLSIVERLRDVAPQVALTTDIIVGFPSETEEEFEETLSLVEQVRFHSAFSFAYSERVRTRALQIEPAVPVEERMRRLRKLQDLQDRITQEWLLSMIGERHRVLIEGPSKTDDRRSTGRTANNRPCHVDGHFEVGTSIEVEIVEAFKHSLRGTPVSP